MLSHPHYFSIGFQTELNLGSDRRSRTSQETSERSGARQVRSAECSDWQGIDCPILYLLCLGGDTFGIGGVCFGVGRPRSSVSGCGLGLGV